MRVDLANIHGVSHSGVDYLHKILTALKNGIEFMLSSDLLLDEG